MTLRSGCALLLAVLLTATTGCTRHATPAPSASQGVTSARSGPPILAYVRQDRVYVADALGSSRALATISSFPEQLTWSPDARRLAWFDTLDENNSSRRLHIANAPTGNTTDIPCPCKGVGFLDDKVATVSADGSALLLFGTDNVPARVPLDHPPAGELAAGGPHEVFLEVGFDEATEPFRGARTLILADANGKTKPALAPAGAPTSYWTGLLSPAGDYLAYIDRPSSGACHSSDSLQLVQLTGGKMIDPGLPGDAAFSTAGLSEDRRYLSITWAGASVVITFAPMINCVTAEPEQLLTYEWNDGGWTALGSGWISAAYGNDQRLVTLEATGRIEPNDDATTKPFTGTLFVTSSGRKTKIAEQVTSFTVTPTEAAAARPPTAVVSAKPICPSNQEVLSTLAQQRPNIPNKGLSVAEGTICAGPWAKALILDTNAGIGHEGFSVFLKREAGRLVIKGLGSGVYCVSDPSQADGSDAIYVEPAYKKMLSCQ